MKLKPFYTFAWSTYNAKYGRRLNSTGLGISDFTQSMAGSLDAFSVTPVNQRMIFTQFGTTGLYDDPRDARFCTYVKAVTFIQGISNSFNVSKDDDGDHGVDETQSTDGGSFFSRTFYNGPNDWYIQFRVEKGPGNSCTLDPTKSYMQVTDGGGGSVVTYPIGGPFEVYPGQGPSMEMWDFSQLTASTNRDRLIWYDYGVASVSKIVDNWFRLHRLGGAEIDIFMLDQEDGPAYWTLGPDQLYAVFTDPRWSTRPLAGTTVKASDRFAIPAGHATNTWQNADVVRFNADCGLAGAAATKKAMFDTFKKWYPNSAYINWGGAGILKQDAPIACDQNGWQQYSDANDQIFDREQYTNTVFYNGWGNYGLYVDTRVQQPFYNINFNFRQQIAAIRFVNYVNGKAPNAIVDMTKWKNIPWTAPQSFSNTDVGYWSEHMYHVFLTTNPANTMFFNAGHETDADNNLYASLIGDFMNNYPGDPTDQQVYFPKVQSDMATSKLGGTPIYDGGAAYGDGSASYDKVFDGNFNTYYDTANGNGWVGMDFGTTRSVLRVGYSPRLNIASRMVGGKIQSSATADFASPVDIYTITATPPENVMTYLAVNVQTRYMRYLSPNGNYCNLSELAFYTLPPSGSVTVPLSTEFWDMDNAGFASARALPNNKGFLHRLTFKPGVTSLALQSIRNPANYFTVTCPAGKVGTWFVEP